MKQKKQVKHLSAQDHRMLRPLLLSNTARAAGLFVASRRSPGDSDSKTRYRFFKGKKIRPFSESGSLHTATGMSAAETWLHSYLRGLKTR